MSREPSSKPLGILGLKISCQSRFQIRRVDRGHLPGRNASIPNRQGDRCGYTPIGEEGEARNQLLVSLDGVSSGRLHALDTLQGKGAAERDTPTCCTVAHGQPCEISRSVTPTYAAPASFP
jgi:hypothetical protein